MEGPTHEDCLLPLCPSPPVLAISASKLLESFRLGKVDHMQLLAQAQILLAQHGHRIKAATG